MKHLFTITSTWCHLAIAFAMALVCAHTSSAAVSNGSFESGFTDWQTTGSASIETASFGVVPTAGTSQALLTTSSASVPVGGLETFLNLPADSVGGTFPGATEGSAIKTTLVAKAGDILVFDWNFLTNEETPGASNDLSFFVSLSGIPSLLGDTNVSFVSSATTFNEETGYGTTTITIPESGIFTLGLSVVDVGDAEIDSALLVDNVRVQSIAVFANDGLNEICFGGEPGLFTCEDLSADRNISSGLALGYIDDDKHIDAVFANVNLTRNRVCLGDEGGPFTCSDVSTNEDNSLAVTLGYINNDTILDAVFANLGRNRVCMGDGLGSFSCSDVSTDENSSNDVALGDIDDDGKLDAVFANAERNRVCIGDGLGAFTCQDLTADEDDGNSLGVALGDVNNDDVLDAVFANPEFSRNRACLGNGLGGFVCSDVSTDSADRNGSLDVALGDMNGDNNLDAIFAHSGGGFPPPRNRFCFGDGLGGFTCKDVSADANGTAGVALADMNDDSNLDAVFANGPAFLDLNRICLGDGLGSFQCGDLGTEETLSRDVALTPEMIRLTFEGKRRDRVGKGTAAVNPDGELDGVFMVRFHPGSGVRIVSGLELVRMAGEKWDTAPSEDWVLGAANSLDGALYNQADTSVEFDVPDGGGFKLFAADADTLFSPGDQFALTVHFADGSSATAATVIPPHRNLDVDGNGQADALTDGILILRFLFGFTGEALTAGEVVAPDCTRCTSEEILAFLQGSLLDADGNGIEDALTDGILILRFLFEFRGDALIAGEVVAPDCTRCTAEDIEAFLETMLPGEVPPVLSITAISPKSGPVGTLVALNGTAFSPNAGAVPQVTMNQQGGGTIQAPIANFTNTMINFTVPTGADTGPITVSVNGDNATSGDVFTVQPSSTFNLAAAPDSASVIQGQETAYALTLNSSDAFGQLSTLTVSGLPPGLSASLKPQQLAAGQTSVLTINAPPNEPLGTVDFSVNASAQVDGIDVNDTVNLTLNVEPITTSFVSRTVIADTLQTPLAGVTVTFLGRDDNGNPTGCSGQTVSDAAGNFAFTNLPPECTGPQLIRYDGLTATNPGQYAGVDLFYDIAPDQVTAAPVLIHLPRIDDAETVLVEQNASEDQVFTFETIPNLEVTVYAGTVFTLVDGTQPDPFPLTAVEVPGDRLPDEKPPSTTEILTFIVAFQPANAEASQPVAVSFPNVLNTAPGTNMNLSTLDPTQGRMVVYGTGTVSQDGTKIVPDFDPANPGKRFGLVHFDWHGQRDPEDPNPDDPCNTCPCPRSGDPIDVGSGVQVVSNTDIEVNSPRGPISIQRTIRSLSTQAGPFGLGSSHNYSLRLDTNNPAGATVINLIIPNGSRFPFALGDNGSFTNQTAPSMRGLVMGVLPDGSTDLRMKDGTVFHFVPATAFLGSLLESITDTNGNRIALVRNPSRPTRITEVIDPVGRKLFLEYDAADRITKITDPIGRTVEYTYNDQGRLETVTDPAGSVTRYGYDAEGRLTMVTDARGVVIAQNIYNEDGRVIEQTQADGGAISFDYITANPQIPNSPVMVATVTDALGNSTTYRYNLQGALTDVTDALEQTRVYTREPGSNLLLGISGPASCEVCGDTTAGDVSFTYDGSGNVLTRTDALGNTTTFTYEPVFNKVASITDPLGNVTTFNYDGRGNSTSRTDENGNTTTFVYNDFGQIVKTTDPLGHETTFSYDDMGNLVSVTDPLGNVTTYRYDQVSRRVATIDALGRKTTNTFDSLDRLVTVTDARGNDTITEYDEVGNRLSVTDARGNTISFTYDEMNRLETRTDSRGNTDTRTYDLNGNLIAFVDRRGQASTFTYDELNRLIEENYDDGDTVTRRYDASGRLIEADDTAGGTFSFTYDTVGELISSAGPFGTVEYVRDQLGRVQRRQVVGQSPVDYAYDPVGNLLSATMPKAGMTSVYNERNQVVSQTRSNGVTTDFTYDPARQLLSIVHSNGPDILEALTYTYDAVGNRTGKTSLTAQPLITQPSVNQYAADSNILQLRDSVTYTHDANGNRLTETSPDATITYNWDSRNRLESVETPTEVTVFRYDFAGNLIGKDTSMPAPTSSQSQRFVLDELTNVVLHSDSNGEQLSQLTGDFIDQHLAAISSDGAVKFALSDVINSTIVTIDETGNVVGTFHYEPFGETTAIGTSYPFQFTGRAPVMGQIYYYRARYYDPLAARFISEDPIGLAGGLNLFTYVQNNPVNNLDPKGLSTNTNCRFTCRIGCTAIPEKPAGLDCSRLCEAVCMLLDCVTVSAPAGNNCTTFVTICPNPPGIGGQSISVDTLCCGQ